MQDSSGKDIMRILSDGNVWFAIGMLCFAVNLALDKYAGVGDPWNFVRGVVTGLSIASFIIAVVIMATQASQKKG